MNAQAGVQSFVQLKQDKEKAVRGKARPARRVLEN